MKNLRPAMLALFVLAACTSDPTKPDGGSGGSRSKDGGIVGTGGSPGQGGTAPGKDDAGGTVSTDGKSGPVDTGSLAGSTGSADAATPQGSGPADAAAKAADSGSGDATGIGGGSGGGASGGTSGSTAGSDGRGGRGGRDASGGKGDPGGISGAGGSTPVGGKTGTSPAGVDGGSASLAKLAWAGVRSSGYGIADAGFRTFPAADKWTTAIKTMAGYFAGAQPSATIWLVGEVDFDLKGMLLEFPKPEDGKSYSSLYQFAKSDKHEPYLSEFDAQGIGVFLEIEPGDADIPTLIDLVLSRYKKHPSVIGLAIDAEWIHKTSETDTETPVTDEQAKSWEALVKSYSAGYRLLLKHFEEGNLPKTYRGDIVFACDDEDNGSYASFKSEMKTFADTFYPNDVLFQIGYPSDHDWWSKLTAPVPQTIGKDLEAQTKQRFGVLWVDFSINDPAIALIP